ncbi:MAG: ABC transporter permease [Patescibacteria group bacterium]|nr:ABC transporter permease [Patescibacteria group bacterium]
MHGHMQTAWHHVRRSPYQSLAAVLIMVLTFLTVSVFTLLIVGSHTIISFFESKPQVTAFFKDEAQKSDIDTLKNQLQATGKVASMKYVSKDEALQIYKQQNKNDPLLLELVTADILPASLEISTYNINDLGAIADTLKTVPAVQEVVYQKDVVTTLESWTTALRRIGAALIVILAGVSIFIMTTIIGIKIAQKREEIEIMRLIGATDWYISWPFLYEGMLYGVVGAGVGWLIATAGLLYMSPFLQSFLQGIPLFPISPLFLLGLLVGEIVLAICLGMISSMIAVRRYVGK